MPLWQLAHCPAVPAWFMRAGRKAAKPLWQLSHCALVGTCVVGLPSALTLLWQLEQRPATAGVADEWSKIRVAQVVVDLWQVSHWAVVATCVACLTWAFCARNPPLWQPMHLPAVPAWFIAAGVQPVVEAWQASHWPVVGMCETGLVRAPALT